MSSVIPRRLGVEQPAEDAGEGEDVVDLVRVVRAPGGDDGRVPLRLRRVDLGVGVGQREHDRLVGHRRRRRTAWIRFGAETPMKTSAPAIASLQRPGAVLPVGLLGDPLQVRVHALAAGWMIPSTSHRDQVGGRQRQQQPDDRLTGGADAADHDPAVVRSPCPPPAARCAARRARRSAVPCWSSWKTGMSSRSRSRSSISKQRGAAMSSRLMPPYTGARTSTVRMISSVSWVSRHTGQASTPAKLLEQRRLALHHRHRGGRADVAEPEHRRAVGDDGDGVALDGQAAGVLGASAIAWQTRATPGV